MKQTPGKNRQLVHRLGVLSSEQNRRVDLAHAKDTYSARKLHHDSDCTPRAGFERTQELLVGAVPKLPEHTSKCIQS